MRVGELATEVDESQRVCFLLFQVFGSIVSLFYYFTILLATVSNSSHEDLGPFEALGERVDG